MKTEPGVLAIINQGQKHQPDLNNQKVTLILDRINDPGNLGSMIRTADWFGVRNVICTKGCVDHYNPKVVQSTMGSIFRVNIYYLEFEEIESLVNNIELYVSDMSGDPITNLNTANPLALVIGSESHGVDERFSKLAKSMVSIPGGESGVESLNAGVACGIFLYHISL
jgi:TrmH family RNA methyltransferase